jgi:hypothetical protein
MKLIDGDALVREISVSHTMTDDYGIKAGYEICMRLVEDAPAIEPKRRTGKWIELNPQNSNRCRMIECDQCGFFHIVGFNVPYEYWIENRNFCERCGAYMGGDTE